MCGNPKPRFAFWTRDTPQQLQITPPDWLDQLIHDLLLEYLTIPGREGLTPYTTRGVGEDVKGII